MPTECFIVRDFKPRSLAIISRANTIIREYQRRGFTLTLRQLYYQFVARDLIENNMKSYKNLGSIINDGRLAGLIDWDAIEDRTRNVRSLQMWNDVRDRLDSAVKTYREDPWKNQTWRPEVWIEKDALVGVIDPVCTRFRVPYFACRGYTSQSELYAAGKRMAEHSGLGQRPVVLHLGDHDPSGLDMTRDNHERLSLFAGTPIMLKRLALNIDQVRRYSPPPNPAKEGDSRAKEYVSRFGPRSWELDALDPTVIENLIKKELKKFVDIKRWNTDMAVEREHRRQLGRVRDEWGYVLDCLEKRNGQDRSKG